jgi:hypothetical protein
MEMEGEWKRVQEGRREGQNKGKEGREAGKVSF